MSRLRSMCSTRAAAGPADRLGGVTLGDFGAWPRAPAHRWRRRRGRRAWSRPRPHRCRGSPRGRCRCGRRHDGRAATRRHRMHSGRGSSWNGLRRVRRWRRDAQAAMGSLPAKAGADGRAAGGAGARAAVPRSIGRPGCDQGERGTDGDGVALGRDDLRELARGRRGDLDIHLVRGDLDDGLALVNAVPDGLEPPGDDPLRNGLAHRGKGQRDRVSHA